MAQRPRRPPVPYVQTVAMKPNALTQYFERALRRRHAAGATIITAGAHSNALYYIVAGSMSVVIDDDDDHEFLLAYLNEGEFFGEIGLFDRLRERSASVRARTNCTIAQLSYECLSKLSEDRPDLILALVSGLSLRVRDTSRKVRDLAFTDVAGRIARALLVLCEQPGTVPDKEGVSIWITRQELSRIAGCSRDMVSRVVRSLEEQRLVRTVGRRIVVIGNRTSSAPQPELSRQKD